MPPEITEMLMTLNGAVVTRVTRNEGRIRIIAVSDTHTFAILMDGCDYQDGCDQCGCDKSKVSLKVERIP